MIASMHDSTYDEMGVAEDRHWWFRAKRRIVGSLLERYPPSTGPMGASRPLLADIGCGTGGLLRELGDRFDTIGFDSSERLPLEPSSVDVVVMSDVLEHLEHDAASVKAVVERLRPGGVLICTVPAHMWLWTQHDTRLHHFRRYTKARFDAVFGGIPLRRELLSWYMFWLFPALAAERGLRRLRGERHSEIPADGWDNPDADGTDGSGPSTAPVPAPVVNAVLHAAFASERHLLGRVPLPCGASLVSVHVKA